MRPSVAGIELPQVQEVRVADTRSLAEHAPPGRDGSLLQDLGRVPTVLTLWGVASDPAAPELIERLKAEMRAGQPVGFVADLTAGTDIADVLIDDVSFRQLAGRPDRYSYTLTLREHVEPAEPEDLSGLDADILGDAAELLDDLIGGLDVAAAFASGLERFTGSLTGLLERLAAFRDDLQKANP